MTPSAFSPASKLDGARLEALLESARLLHESRELDPLLRHLLRTAMGRLLVRRGVIAVRHADGELRIALCRGASGLQVGACYDETTATACGIEKTLLIGPPESPVGLLGVGGSGPQGISAEECEFVAALLGLAASVITNAQAHEEVKRANQALDQRLQELRALLDLGRALAATLDPEEVARIVGLTLAGRWAVSRYAVAACRPHRPLVERRRGLQPLPPDVWRDAVAALPTAVVVEDESPIPGWALAPGSLVLPVRGTQEAPLGVIACGPRPRGVAYTEADREFGAGLAAQAAVAFENAWHFQETLLKQQMEKELALAAQIQADLFPARLPSLAGIDLAARNRQARQVGGDYYDALALGAAGPEQPHLLCVADIAGKGLPAALLMSIIQATLRALVQNPWALKEVAVRANDLIWATTPANRYATAFLVSLDPVSGACRFVNCGHNAAVLLRADDTVEMLEGTGFALGLFPRRDYDEGGLALQPGDLLAVYSDGVSEAQDSLGEEFEMERLVACLREARHENAGAIVSRVFAAIDQFAGAAPQFDDITMMVVKRTA